MRRRARRRQCLALLPPHHAAARLAVHHGRGDAARHRCPEGVRHDLRHHAAAPAPSSETMNIYLYQQAFGYYDIGYASAIVVVFFILSCLTLLLMRAARGGRRGMNRAPAQTARRQVGLALSRPGADLARDAVLLVDAVAVAEERGRQHGLSAGLHPERADARQFPRRLREEQLPRYTLTRSSSRSPPRRSRCWSAFPPAMASPRRAPRRPPRSSWSRASRRASAISFRCSCCSSGSTSPARCSPLRHHASRDHRADRRLCHDRLFRGIAERARGSGARGRRHDLAGVPPRRVAAGPARHHGRDDPLVHLQLEQFHLRRRARRPDARTLPVAVYNVLTFEQISWGPLAAAALLVTAPVLLLTLLMQREIVAGLTAGGVKGG